MLSSLFAANELQPHTSITSFSFVDPNAVAVGFTGESGRGVDFPDAP